MPVADQNRNTCIVNVLSMLIVNRALIIFRLLNSDFSYAGMQSLTEAFLMNSESLRLTNGNRNDCTLMTFMNQENLEKILSFINTDFRIRSPISGKSAWVNPKHPVNTHNVGIKATT